MNDTDEKEQLAVHIMLGASDFAKIKVEATPRVVKIGKPFAELTKMGWVMMSPGRDSNVVSALCTQTSINEKLCSTDILGLEESYYDHDELVFEKFKKQLNRSKEGWYETVLIWTESNIPLEMTNVGFWAD